MSKNKQDSEASQSVDRDLNKCRVPAVVCPYHKHQAGPQLQQPGGLTRALSGRQYRGGVYAGPSLHRAAIYQRNNRHIVEGIQ